MNVGRRFLVLVGALLSIVIAPWITAALVGGVADARAQGDAAAKQFTKGREHYKAGDYEIALPLFRAALESSGSPNARLYLARSLRQLGRLPEAYDELRATLDETNRLVEGDKKYAPTRDAAATELAKLEKQVGRVVIAVPEAARGAEVSINGVPLDTARIGTPIGVRPGAVHVVAQHPTNGSRDEHSREVKAGTLETIVLFGVAAPAEEKSGDVAPKPTGIAPRKTPGGSDDPSPWTTTRSLGVAVAALGVAGGVAFAVLGSMAQDRESELIAGCGDMRCTDPQFSDLVDDGTTLQTAANVSLALGGTALVAGVLMILLGGPDDATPAQAISVRATPVGDHRTGLVGGVVVFTGQM